MSLKRYAIIAAVSYHNHHNHQHNSTAITSMSAATTSATSSSQTPLQLTPQQSTIITAKTSLFSSTSGYGTSSSSSSSSIGSGNYNNYNNNNSNGSSNLPGYYGGLSLFHQQNIRSGSGTNNNNGATYPNAINSNVNLLLGGAMLSLVTTILCIVCYCCHRSIRKRTEAAYRQQRQWLESDPNMEIYSVEQCYETSGLFMGESTDGLSTVPTLHHEPPPSYDAVVLMQEQQLLYQQQQQQQQLLQQQRTSPPPGYRSTLDVAAIVAATTSAATSPAAVYVSTDGLSYLNNHHVQTNNNNTTNNNSYNNSCDNINNDNQNNAVAVNRNDLAKISVATRYASQANPILSMKKVWNAQSCCSLQRAEVENMWNAAAAAVAARATHAENTQHSMTNLRTRKSLPSGAAASTTTMTAATGTISPPSNGRFGRRYLKQSYYRSGCPLCGKFRYNADDGSLSISIESNLDQPMASIHNTNNNSSSNNSSSTFSDKDKTQAATVVARVALSNNNDGNVGIADIDGQQSVNDNCNNNNNNSTNNVAAASSDVEDDDECSCTLSSNTTTAAAVDAKRATDDADDDDENGNMYAGAGDSVEYFAAAVELNTFYQAADDADIPSGSSGSNAQNMTSSCDDTRVNSTFQTETLPTTAAAAQNESVELVDLDSINENGIVRLDMSKIIDRTGLPTYEAALKLDSSGYV